MKSQRDDHEAKYPLLPYADDSPQVVALREQIQALESENELLRSKVPPKKGAPGVVGFAGFGATTLLLQIHNFGIMGLGPIVWLGLVFGGLAQFIAGLQEFHTGDNFGYCAFTSYGAFWLAFGLLQIGNKFGIYTATPSDVGWFLVVFTVFSLILFFISSKKPLATFGVFFVLIISLILLDVEHLIHDADAKKGCKMASAIFFVITAFGAWYLMAAALCKDLWGRDVLPVGRPLADLIAERMSRRRLTHAGAEAKTTRAV